ncbi:beta-ketoacyl synthase N-terminal-like domain-containing protein [Nocardia sp. NPDC127579]|uniref:beta-ketoacyl synthase N-terminal-like domain-containing protein n=1 Tax=Nocardia sp. NPDC127579 TaxID=3345402 RepID=UPI003637AB0C
MSAAVRAYAMITSIGADASSTYRNLCQGRSGLGPLRGQKIDRFKGQQAYQIDDGQPEAGRASRLVIEAIRQASDEAGIDLGRTPVLIGTGLAEIRTLELAVCEGRTPGPAELDLGHAVRAALGASDVTTVVNACSASLHALAAALDLLALGEAEEVVVAGVDVVTASMHGLLDRVQPVTPDALRPFESGPKGVIMGEGAAAVVLTSRAVEGAFEVRSVGVNCDAGHVTNPDRNGMADSIRLAHTMAGVTPADIDLVMLHGTGTPQNDTAESAAMTTVFGDQIGKPAAVAIKSMIGHTSGASGLIAVLTAIESMRHGTTPHTTLGRAPVDEARLLRFGAPAPDEKFALAQVNAFGFGGVNAVAIIAAATAPSSTAVPEITEAGTTFPVIAATAMAPEVDPRTVMTQRGLRYKDRASLTAMALSTAVLADPVVARAIQADPDRVAVVVASNLGNVDTVARVAREIDEGGIAATSPMDLPNASPNVVASSVAILHGFRGPNLLVSGYPGGLDEAVTLARRLLAAGRADHVLVIGVEPATDIAVAIGGERRTGAVALLVARSGLDARPAVGVVDAAGFTPVDGADSTVVAVWDRLHSTSEQVPAAVGP